MKKKILQGIADFLISKLEENFNNQQQFDWWYQRAQTFDSYCINYFGLYLD